MTYLSTLIGDPEYVTATAGENLSGNMAVRLESGSAYYADAGTSGHAGKVIGLTTGAASIGESVSIQTRGEMVEPSWLWAPGSVWLGSSGALTQTPPAAGISQVIGVSINATRLSITINQPYIKAT